MDKILTKLYYIKKKYLMVESLRGRQYAKTISASLAEYVSGIKSHMGMKMFLANMDTILRKEIPDEKYAEWEYADYEVYTEEHYHRKFWNEIENPEFVVRILEKLQELCKLKNDGDFALSLYDFNDYDLYFESEEAAEKFMSEYGADTVTLFEKVSEAGSECFVECWSV